MVQHHTWLAMCIGSKAASIVHKLAAVLTMFQRDLGEWSSMRCFASCVTSWATYWGAESLFASDYQDGSLEQLLISPQLIVMPVLGKVTAHWLTTGLPLTLVSPLLGLLLSLPTDGYLPMMAGLALGTGCLSLLAALGAALTVSLPKGGLLLTLIVMPLYMPVIIFGSATVQYSVQGLAWTGPLAILGGMLALAIALCPLAISSVLRLTTIN